MSIQNNTTEDFTVTGIVSTLGKNLKRSETAFTAIAGQTHEIILTFAPREAGDLAGKLSIFTDRDDSRTINVAITGTALRVDTNGDGTVNIFDLVLVGSQFGKADADPNADVNGDGKINIFDLVAIGAAFGQSIAAAPSLTDVIALPDGEVEQVRQALAALETMDNPSSGALAAIKSLRAWLAIIDPPVTETKLLANYPNPFNPETWIPYQLAEAATVMIEIYDVLGQRVRQLDVGLQPRGYYISREKAAYWDGRNETGERIASGIYFYHIRAGEYVETRKMSVLK